MSVQYIQGKFDKAIRLVGSNLSISIGSADYSVFVWRRANGETDWTSYILLSNGQVYVSGALQQITLSWMAVSGGVLTIQSTAYDICELRIAKKIISSDEITVWSTMQAPFFDVGEVLPDNRVTSASTWNQGVEDAATALSTANSAASAASTAASNAAMALNNANAAQTAANNAQTAANTANSLLSDIASDSKLTALEKQATKKEWDAIVSEKTILDNQADAFSITTEKINYGNSYNTLSTYITPLLVDLTTTSDIVGTTFRADFKDYYDKKITLLNAISAKAKQLADAAQTTANTASTNANTAASNAATAISIANTAATNASTALNGTVKYRTNGVPTNNPNPTGITVAQNANGTINIRVSWAQYTQGAKQADFLLLFWKSGPAVNQGSVNLTDACIAFNVNTTGSSYYDFEGLAPKYYSFGMAAVRRTENGPEIGAIQCPASNPDWQDVNATSAAYNAGTVPISAAGGNVVIDSNGVRGYNGGVLQTEMGTDGRIVAGAGAVKVGANGIFGYTGATPRAGFGTDGRFIAGAGAVKADETGLKTYNASQQEQCSIGVNGEITAGAGSVRLGVAGLRTYNGANLQCGIGTDGALFAGGGAVKADAAGLHLYSGSVRVISLTNDGRVLDRNGVVVFDLNGFIQRKKLYTTPGNFSFTVPAGIYVLTVSMSGAGAGGGWGNIPNTNHHGGAGGGGAAINNFIMAVTPGQVINGHIGTKGIGGYDINHKNGTNGDTTTFGSLSCAGGYGGTGTTSSVDGADGLKGGPGGENGLNGVGGGSLFGIGGQSFREDGSGYGGGGAGGYADINHQYGEGGDGTNGFVQIEF